MNHTTETNPLHAINNAGVWDCPQYKVCQGVTNTSLGGAIESCRECVVYPASGEGGNRGSGWSMDEEKA